MAPKVTVPMNFGRHLIGSPTHSNLKLNVSEGGEVRASSVILSFNSPVIDHMTTTLHMTSVDMLEFREAAVQLFVDAAYSGTAEGLTRDIFRDINKIAHVFEMTWLSEKCTEYFNGVVQSVKTPSYTELLYLFEEAGFVFENLKTKDFLNVTIKKIEVLKYKQEFIDMYLENADRLSTQRLDMVIELAGTEVNCVVQTLTNQLSELLKVQGSSLPFSCEYLLDNSNLYLCRESDRVLFEQLFDYLRELPDWKIHWMFDLYRKSVNKSSPLTSCTAVSEVGESSSTTVSRCNTIPNLYHNLDMNITFNELLDWLSESEQITSVLMAIEAVWTWNRYQTYVRGVKSSFDISSFPAKLKDVVKKREWSLLPLDFKTYGIWFNNNHKQVFLRPNLTPFYLSPKETCSYVIIDCVDTCTKPYTFLSKEGKLTFYFKHPSVTACYSPGLCGFILKTVPSEAALWTMRLCTGKEEYCNESVHFHDEVRADEMHVHFVQTSGSCPLYLRPLSWLGWLHSGSSAGQRNEWEANFGLQQDGRFKVLYKFDACKIT